MSSERGHALPILLLAVAAFAAATAALADAEIAGAILGWWPLVGAAAALSWFSVEAWSPRSSSVAWQGFALAMFVAIQAVAAAPLAFILADSLGPDAIRAWITMSGLCFFGLVGYGLLKPTYEITPTDAFVTLAITVGSVGLAVAVFDLPFGNVVGAGLVAIINIVLLDRIGDALMLAGPGRGFAAATRMFGCSAVIAGELGWGMLRWPQVCDWLLGWLK